MSDELSKAVSHLLACIDLYQSGPADGVKRDVVKLTDDIAAARSRVEALCRPPEGWVLVPREPTEEMWQSGAKHCIQYVGYEDTVDNDEAGRRYVAIGCAVATYIDMIAAAPPTPAQTAEGGDEYVAEVLWFDPQTRHFPEEPGKVIDASMAWLTKAPIGTKLYERPAQTAQREARHGEVYVNGALVLCEERDREPCPHNPERRCATCPGGQPEQREALSDADKQLRSSLIKIAADAIALRTWGEPLKADASAQLDEQIARLAIALRAAADGIGCQP